MPLYPLQPVFARGELSPRLFSRADIDHYKMGLAECVNWMVMKQGGLRRRPGTEWINYAKNPLHRTRLQKFVFSTIQAYVLEFGDYYVRFYANGGVVNKNAASPIYFDAPNVVHWDAHTLVVDDPVQFSSTGFLPPPLVVGRTYYVKTVIGVDDFTISDTKGGAAITWLDVGAGTNGGLAPVELATPYSISDVWRLQFAQSADVLYIAHPDIPQKMLSRFTGSTFQLVPYTGYDGPYLPENTTTTRFDPVGTSGNIVVNSVEAASLTPSTVGVNGGVGFVASDVNRWISLKYSNKWYGLKITEIVSATSVKADVKGLIADDGKKVTSLPGQAPTGGWRLGAWCETTGYPGCVTFYQQRLIWARSDTQPQTIWMSRAGVLDNFAVTSPLQDDDALTITILAGEVNAISWIVEASDLLIGTNGAMRTLGPADTGKNFGPTNFMQKRQSTFGSLDIQPIQVAEVAIYPSFYGLSLREFLFSFQVNGYVSPELTILSEHMLRSGIKQMSYAQDKDGIIWNAMGNGELVGITYDRDQQIVACTRHRIAGKVVGVPCVPYPSDDSEPEPDTPWGIVESVATIPGLDRSEVWLSVRRTINGEETRYIERMTITFEAQPKADAVFVDSSYSYSGASASAVSGASWLAGETIGTLADGAVMPESSVSEIGSISLPAGKSASKITFGLNYLSRAKTLAIAQGQQDGTGLGRRKNIISANIDVMETGYLEIGSPSARELQVKVGLRGVDDPMDTSPPLRDGIFAYRFDRSWRDKGQIVMQTDKPLPATIRSVTPVFDAE
jgi:hypothetical protein